MKKTLHWVFADLFLNKRFTFFFILNLSLGLTGFIALDSFRHHLESSISLKSRQILGADLGISSRTPFTDQQKSSALKVLDLAPSSEMIETYSMVASRQGDSRLTQIKAIDNNYPFYGTIKLQKQGDQDPSKSYDLIGQKNVWVYPEVLSQLGLKLGDSLKVGSQYFTITDVVEDDSAAGFSTSMAPRIYMALGQIRSTGLISPQSIAWYSIVYKKPSTDQELKNFVNKLFDQKDFNEGVKVYSHKSASAQMSRMLTYLTDYLGLVSIAAIFLAGIGAAFLYRSYMNSKIKEVAIFRSLGMTHKQSLRIYVLQVLALGLMASALSFVLSLGVTPLLTKLLNGLVSVPIDLRLRPQGVGMAVILGVVGSLLVCMPILLQMKDIKPSVLFQSMQLRLKDNYSSLFVHFLGLITMWLLSVWQSNSWIVGSSFIAIFLLCGVLLSAIAYAAVWLFNNFSDKLPLTLKMAIRSLVRQPKMTIPCFLALGLGVILLNIIPQIEASIQKEIKNPSSSLLPSFFLFDLQQDQVSSFKSFVSKNNKKLGQVSPMIRSRIIKVNGLPFEKMNSNKEVFTREQEQEARFRNRGFNLSYRDQLDDSETIISGQKFTGRFDPSINEVAEVSLEKRFAGRLGLKLGDQLTFEIQSIPIEAKVVNLRSVRWTSFQPNFFIQFQPGVLESAPQTSIATIMNMPKDEKVLFQNKLVKKFPNISIIDVTRIVKRISSVSEQMSAALQFMALLCLLIGLSVMYSISSHQAYQRRQDINLIKILGADFSMIRNLFVIEFAVLATLAGFVGILLSVGVSFTISYFMFDGIWSWAPSIPLISFILLILMVSTLAYFSVRRVVNSRARFYLH